ncbi:sodium-coupled monocarboxylate transporter 1-like [Ruditapes philippinarum]|uniref:sodium-coupled monocarboxylate transporter 1-like n=1 Tax=Ruditapes philippinarum TaxID=129788 RepID=UPI00295AF33F|nr:sodium-coupled monocarboxylate transporter 1-like [Ruditapes philippinarum]
MADGYSIETGQKRTFGSLDYVLFSLMFCFSAAIGFYHAYKDRNKKKTEDFHLGGRKMHPIPVSLSLSATFLSALMLLGTPSEIYTNGTMFYWITVAMLIATAGAAHIFLPVFYRLNTTSCFQYLEMRFGKVTRTIASILFLIQTVVYMGFVLYAPSLAFEAVTGVSLWGCMIGTAAVCTLYTTLGGLKTVLWTDSLQFSIMLAGLLVVLIEGTKATGGFSNAWDIANDHGRLKFDDFSFDPKTRHSVWTVAIGGSFFWLYLYGINQAQIQRACSLPTLRRAQVAMWLNFPGLVLIVTLTVLIGVVMFAFYSQCHPVKFGIVNKIDQLLPLFVLDTLGTVPGLSGVFIACVFSGGLSTISSGLNAMSAVLMEDFIKPFCCGSVVKKHGIFMSKALVVVIGVIQFGVAVLISRFSGLILQFSYSMYSITAGPIFGLFVAGMIFPWTNKYGAPIGFLASLAFMCWLGLGALIEKPSGYKPLPTYTLACNWTTIDKYPPVTTLAPIVTGSSTITEEPILYDFYRMSYQWYTGLGMIICVFVSLLASFLTGYTKASTIDSRLMCPILDILFPFLPENILKPLRFGVK